ncbi:MAG: hypothetical protein LBJ31_08305 [Treponema sp.]|jgi:hypothetical protein|nr:hypothetical protein [Treponema sp.]
MQYYGDGSIVLKIFSVRNGIYEKEKEIEIFENKHINNIDVNWIDDDQFKIDCGEDGVLLVKRNNYNGNFELFYQ